MKLLLLIVSFFYHSIVFAQISVDQQPVSIRNWSVFLNFIHSDSTLAGAYSKLMTPDIWSTAQNKNKDINAPVVGVSRQQALVYCKWRSVVATYLQTHPKLSAYQVMKTANKSAKKLIIYRLPSEEEWVKLASRYTKDDDLGVGFRCVRYSVHN